jgi:3-hydroxybutyryl-CoA dehydratase
MKRPILDHRVPESIEVGRVFRFRRTLTEGDVSQFIGATWDVNPLHTDEVYAKGTDFGARIVPGLLTASLLTHLGGLWAFMATRMELHFLAPVYIGETIIAQAEVEEHDEKRGWVRLKCQCLNEEGKQVLSGEVEGFPGVFKEKSEV